MRHVSLFLAMALPAITQAAPYIPTMTGDQFVKMMNMAPQTEAEYRNRDRAYSYLDGARDSTEGRLWCEVRQLKTPDLAQELAARIAKMVPAERQKNAAGLLLGLLQSQYPCRGGAQ